MAVAVKLAGAERFGTSMLVVSAGGGVAAGEGSSRADMNRATRD